MKPWQTQLGGIVESQASQFARLIDKFHSGDPGALALLYSEYGGVVREAVRRQLPDRLRKEYDSLDFAQDVWASVCQLPRDRHQFATPEELGGFLARIAHNKVIDVCRRRLGTKKHDITREQQLPKTGEGGEVPVADHQPSPSQWAIAGERWATIAAALPPHHVAVVEWLREGYTQQEVADMIGITDRTVRRIVDRVQRICEGKS